MKRIIGFLVVVIIGVSLAAAFAQSSAPVGDTEQKQLAFDKAKQQLESDAQRHLAAATSEADKEAWHSLLDKIAPLSASGGVYYHPSATAPVKSFGRTTARQTRPATTPVYPRATGSGYNNGRLQYRTSPNGTIYNPRQGQGGASH